MSRKTRVKMTKDIVPEGFTLGLVIVDLFPVIFFGATGALLGLLLNSSLIIFASVMTFFSGLFKVLWKLIVVLKKKNFWPLFIQMRIIMPISMLLLVIGVIIAAFDTGNNASWSMLLHLPQTIFFVLGILGMCLMGYWGATLDSSDPKSNWIEQITNSIAQALMFLGVLLTFL